MFASDDVIDSVQRSGTSQQNIVVVQWVKIETRLNNEILYWQLLECRVIETYLNWNQYSW